MFRLGLDLKSLCLTGTGLPTASLDRRVKTIVEIAIKSARRHRFVPPRGRRPAERREDDEAVVVGRLPAQAGSVL